MVRKGATTIVHLLSFAPERRGELDIVEDALPLVELPISIRTDRPPKRVELAPAGRTAGPRVPRRLRHGARHPARGPRHADMPMITMRSDWWNPDCYYPWIDPLFRRRSGRKSTSTGIYTCSRSATRPTTLAAALQRARDRYRGAVTGLLSAAQESFA